RPPAPYLRLVRSGARVQGLRPGCQLRSCARGEPARPPPAGSHRTRNNPGWGWWRSRGATGGEPSPPLASAASRRVGPCTRRVVQRSCTGGPGAASASVTLGLGVPGNLLWRISGVSRRADSERSGPSSDQPIPSLDFTASLCFDLAVRPFKLFHTLI